MDVMASRADGLLGVSIDVTDLIVWYAKLSVVYVVFRYCVAEYEGCSPHIYRWSTSIEGVCRKCGRTIGRLSIRGGNDAAIKVEGNRMRTGRCLCIATIRVISRIVRVDRSGGTLLGWISIEQRSVRVLGIEGLLRRR